MNSKNLEMLNTYIKNNVAPILIEKIPKEVFSSNAVVLDAKVDKTLLNGHYEQTEYLPPLWYQELQDKEILIIDQLSSIPKVEQKKFIEILKYRKISTFLLPKECVIIITCDDIQNISEEVCSLVAYIGDK